MWKIIIILLCRMLPRAGIKLCIRRGNDSRSNPKNRVKRRHRIKPAVETEYVFIEVGLQMFWLDTTMMRSLNPSFQVAENEMDHRQMRLCLVGIAAKGQRLMPVLSQSGIACPSVRADNSPRRDVVPNKSGKRNSATIWNHTKPQTPRIDFPPVRLAVSLSRPNLNSADHYRLVVSAVSFSARLAANKAFINLNRILATDCVSFGPNHARAELVKYLKSGFIAADSKLALELNSRLAGDLRGHEIRAPEPRRERRVARLHDRASRKRCIDLTCSAPEHYGRTGRKAVWLTGNATFRAGETIRPANGLKVLGAGGVIGENPLKLRKRSREAANVHA